MGLLENSREVLVSSCVLKESTLHGLLTGEQWGSAS